MNSSSLTPPAATGSELYLPKEISWLAFNERVLQEAEHPDTPLIERIRYLGIFSNNMDEFFRVRVADLKRRTTFLSGKEKETSDQLYEDLQKKVGKLQKRFDQNYLDTMAALHNHHIYLIDESQIKNEQKDFLVDYFYNQIQPALKPILFSDTTIKLPPLSDGIFYLGIRLTLDNGQIRYSVLEVPSPPLPRFVVLPSNPRHKEKVLIVLENIIRLCLKDVFRGTLPIAEAHAYAFKLTRDAELELGDGISQSLMDKMSTSLKKRKHGDPVRFVYDKNMPEDLLGFLVKQLGFGKYDSLIAGERYHNFKDFMKFPNLGPKSLEHKKLPPIKIPLLEKENLMFDAIRQNDILLYFPYHPFSYIENLLYAAALDPLVRSIKITLYRLASDSHIISALINAVNNQKQVTVVVELQARFDEQANIQWANQLTEAGANVIFGIPGLKVHSKLILIERQEGSAIRYYSHIGTGNFNESTARIYTDFSLLTHHQEIGAEVANIFDFIRHTYKQHTFKHLLVSPYGFRSGINALIDQEIRAAQSGQHAAITLKCNNLVDQNIIERLYAASQAGVKIRLIVRGMMSLVPGLRGVSDNIEAISIVDRLLEHARVYMFENSGDPLIYFGSGDLMTRNLDHRVEVICPVYNASIKEFVRDVIELQWNDNEKARILDSRLSNQLQGVNQTGGTKKRPLRSQMETQKLVKAFEQKGMAAISDNTDQSSKSPAQAAAT